IRPCNTTTVDVDRIAWLRVYGIPAHAWNDSFSEQISKQWGLFMKTDDATNKKFSMDVARLLIRTPYQKAVDDFFDVVINGETFHLRVVEDSYGPMRLMVEQSQGKVGRPLMEEIQEEDEEDEGEEEERRRFMEEEEVERDSEGEGDNLLVLNYAVNTINSPCLGINHAANSNLVREDGKENSFISINASHNSNLNQSKGGTASSKGVLMKDNMVLNNGIDMGQEVGEDGPVLSIFSNHIVKEGGAVL
ncbi:DUF4283 domain protein, partial [Trifolium medium]|nr:DUF4283 domain protein [Trifolium medium]